MEKTVLIVKSPFRFVLIRVNYIYYCILCQIKIILCKKKAPVTQAVTGGQIYF